MAKTKTIRSCITIKRGDNVNYPEALSKQLNKDVEDTRIIILPPFNRFNEYIFLFPVISHEISENNEALYHVHKNYIFYKGKWHKPENVFGDISIRYGLNASAYGGLYDTTNVYAILDHCKKCLKLKTFYTIQYNYLNLTSPKQVDFKQEAIQPLRNLFSKFGFLGPDNRGKGSKSDINVRKEIRKVIIASYRKAKIKRPIPMKYIQNDVQKYLVNKFPSDSNAYERYSITDSTIRRILKSGTT
ncbi:MAG: hypothetical protein V1682_02385 [Candidatus Omnitrophota bacterium]